MPPDLGSVVDHLGAGGVALRGVTSTGTVAVAYAARYSEQMAHLILWCPVVDGSVYENGLQQNALRRLAETNRELFT